MDDRSVALSPSRRRRIASPGPGAGPGAPRGGCDLQGRIRARVRVGDPVTNRVRMVLAAAGLSIVALVAIAAYATSHEPREVEAAVKAATRTTSYMPTVEEPFDQLF